MSAAGCGRIRILAARRNSRSALIAKEDLAMQFEGNFVTSSRENTDTVRPNQQAEVKFEQIIGSSNSRFTSRSVPELVEVLETTDSESGVHAELRRERAHVKLLLELAKQAVSNQELRDVLRAVITSIRNGVLCDGVCICLIPSNGGELQVCALDFPNESDFQEGATIPLSGTIVGHVVQTAKPWCGSREEACTYFPRQLLLAPGFTTGCMLPIPGRHPVLGTLGLVRRENNSFTEDEIDFLTQVSNQIRIAVENARAYQQIRELTEKLAQESVYVQDDIRDESNFV